MQVRTIIVAAVAAMLLGAGAVQADVFNMDPNVYGPNVKSLEMVTVGDPGNAGELSGAGAGGYGPDRICGAVSYEYRIGKYEVTAGQYTEFLNAVGGVDTYALYNMTMSNTSSGSGITQSGGGTGGNPYTYSVATDFANRPVNWVSFWDACRFVNWLNNDQPTGPQDAATTERGAYTLNGYKGADGRTIQRNANAKWAVTSEDEWYKAAYYKGGSTDAGYWDYPTSSNSVPGTDMTEATNPGNNVNYYYGSGMPIPIDSGKYTTVAGEFQLSDSPYGTFDQGGNVVEWNEAIVYEGSDWSYCGLRGGSFYGGNYDYLHASYRGNDTYYAPPTYEYDNVGFRVSEVPEPGSAVLLIAGAVAVFRRRAMR